MLKVLHLAFTIDETSEVLNEHCLGALGRYDLAVCSFNPPYLDRDPGLRIHAGDGTVRGYVPVLIRALRTERPDVVHSHSAHVGAFAQIFGPLARVGYRRRSVHTVHTSFPNIKARNRLLTAVVFAGSGADRLLQPRQLRQLPLPLAPSGRAAPRLDRQRRRPGPHRWGAVACPPLADRAAGAAPAGLRIASVGRLMAIKGHHTVVDALASLDDPALSLEIIGSGVSQAELAERIDRQSLSARVTLAGGLARDEVYRRLANADLFVSASTVEGLPMAVLEALACGRPAILSDIAPHRELVADGDAVALVPVDDPAALAAAIIAFAALDPDARQRLRRESRATAERFGLSGTLDRYGEIYAHVAEHVPERQALEVR